VVGYSQEQGRGGPVSQAQQPDITQAWEGWPSGVPRTRGPRIMGLFTKDIKTMNDLFVHQLQDIYYAEKQLVKALPRMPKRPPIPS
jgi:hypothetical protein